MAIDRKIYFDSVRPSLFSGGMSQSQVDGQNAILNAATALVQANVPWLVKDLRHLAYAFATTYHETSKKMQPIEEYGKGQGMSYGKKDPQTGQTYYGRGLVQLTWRDNYAKATKKLGLTGDNDLEWHADRALDPTIASDIMFQGMEEGWFRSDDHGKETLTRYFNGATNDPFNAREIINGDRNTVPDWSNGVSIGNLIANYHDHFLTALEAAYTAEPAPAPTPEPTPEPQTVDAAFTVPDGVGFTLTINGKQVYWA